MGLPLFPMPVNETNGGRERHEPHDAKNRDRTDDALCGGVARDQLLAGPAKRGDRGARYNARTRPLKRERRMGAGTTRLPPHLKARLFLVRSRPEGKDRSSSRAYRRTAARARRYARRARGRKKGVGRQAVRQARKRPPRQRSLPVWAEIGTGSVSGQKAAR